MLYQNLDKVDPEMDQLIRLEEERQRTSLELIASENFTSVSVLQANGSVLTNKYSEGQVGNRYYGGNEYIDKIEILCKKRALELFKLDPEVWDVNVQTLSGTCANFAVYTALIGKNGKIAGLDLPSGGHLSHGYQSKTRKISATSIFFDSQCYKSGADGEIDYKLLQKDFDAFRPDILVCGGSAYPKDFDYKKYREIAGETYLMMDMAHVSGIIAAGLMNNPFEYCDVVTTTTHKILRGPRSAMIFYKKIVIKNGVEINVKNLIDFAVFPGLQGGPHNQKIGALAVALKQASSPEYSTYIRNVLENAKTLCSRFQELGYKLVMNGTESHMILICLENVGGMEVQRVCELASISVNKNCIPTDKSPLRPTGLRLGTPALTTRGFSSADFIKVANLVDEAIKISIDLSRECKNEKDLDIELFEKKAAESVLIKDLKQRICDFTCKFPIPKVSYCQDH
jgi:glycine hydroxymethyltransferase